MKSWKIPTPEEINRAVALLSRREHYRYFFDRLENPEWINALKSKGFFTNPPDIQIDEARGTIATPPWPESRYLSRMAAVKPDVVLEVIIEVPDTHNPSIHEDFIEAALAMPAQLAARLVEKIKGWIHFRQLPLVPEKIGNLVSHLARGKEVGAARELVRTLLTVVPGPELPKKIADEYRLPPEPQARFDLWYYGEILKNNIPDLVTASGEETLLLLCELLGSAIALKRGVSQSDKPEDLSYIWRPAIEDHPQNQLHGIATLLASAVRDTAEQIAKTEPAKVPKLVRILEDLQWHIFQRIALHLLRLFPAPAWPLVVERLTDQKRFEEDALHHEYVLLLQSQFAKLHPEQQKQILGWIADGPDLEAFRSNAMELSGKEPSGEDTNEYVRRWQLRHLAPLRDGLPSDWKGRYDDLVKNLGEPEHPEFVSYSTSWVGPTSPKSAADLRSMGIEELVTFLKSWQPKDNHMMAPSPEGLGRELTAIVALDPEPYAKEARQFQNLDPTYVRGIMSGFRDAINQKRVFPWPPVLELCQWVVNQPRDIPGRESGHLERDPGWGWIRKTIADLLEKGFQDGPTEISFDFRELAWNILRQITDDPEPDQAYEARYGGSNMDPATLSINTTRGEAMHAVLQYALWVRRHIEKSSDAGDRLARGFDEMPEVREVLDVHLEVPKEPSLAIRSVYGRWFPWLFLLDPKWAQSKTATIFPSSDSLREFFEAAWNTYIVFCQPYNNVFEVLEPIYGHAVGRLSATAEAKSRAYDPDHHLAEHLMTFYWRGKLDLDERNGLLARFWEKAHEKLRVHAMEFVGRSLGNTKEDIPSEISQRFQALWASRLALAKSSASPETYKEELAAFGWWFMAGKLDLQWEVLQLKEVLLLTHKIDPDRMVVERLAQIAGTLPRDSVECLRLLVEAEGEPWGIYAWRDEARKLLATAIQGTDPQARVAAIELVHRLGAMGHLEFRDLLPPSTQ